jgi:hypothetical protein
MSEPVGVDIALPPRLVALRRHPDFGNLADLQERGVAIGAWSFWNEDPPKGSITFENPPAAID